MLAGARRKTGLVGTRISGRERRGGSPGLSPRPLGDSAGPGAAEEPAPASRPEIGRIGRAESVRRARYLETTERQKAEQAQQLEQPAYIRACFSNPLRTKTYWVYTWKPGEPDKKKRIPYQCGSWKCPYCREFAGHVLWSRLQEAFRSLDSSGVVFLVLTLEPEQHRRAKWDLDEIYREFSRRQNVFTKRLRRLLLDRYGYDMGNRWASVTECHRSGVPHVNIALYHPDWAKDLAARRKALLTEGMSEFEAIQAEPTVLRHAEDCGFGWRCTAEANRYGDTEAISGYLVKGVKNADAMHGEICKLSQLPVMAPKNFRRLRSGKRFLPPKRQGDCTGTVIRRYYTPEGDEMTEPLARPKLKPRPPAEAPESVHLAWEADTERKLTYLAEVEHAMAVEQVMAWRDESFRGQSRPTKREELITTFHRREDGRTVCGGFLVLNTPRRPHEQANRDRDDRDQRSRDPTRGHPGSTGGGRAGPTSAPSKGGPLDGSIRVPETADPAEQLAFRYERRDACASAASSDSRRPEAAAMA